jgi:tetratricopeptide (TPR) repeat protein
VPSLGHLQAALDSYQKALTIQDDLARRGLLTPAQRESLAFSYMDQAAFYRTGGNGTKSVESATHALELAKNCSSDALAKAYATLASSQASAGNPTDALKTASLVIPQYLKRIEAENQPWSSSHHSLAALYVLAARSSARTAQFDAAASYFQKAIDLRERRLAAPVLDSVNAQQLILAYHGAGDILGATDRFSLGLPYQAVPYYRKAVALAERLSAADQKNAQARLELARSYGKLGAALESDQPAEAIRLYERAQKIAEDLLPEGPERRGIQAAADSSIGVALESLGRHEEALRRLRSVLDICQENLKRLPAFGAYNDVASAWLALGRVETKSQPRVAIGYLRNALAAANEAERLAPRDLSTAFQKVSALEALLSVFELTHGDPSEIQTLHSELVATWKKWALLQPSSPFLQDRLRQSRKPRKIRRCPAQPILRSESALIAVYRRLSTCWQLRSYFPQYPQIRFPVAARNPKPINCSLKTLRLAIFPTGRTGSQETFQFRCSRFWAAPS